MSVNQQILFTAIVYPSLMTQSRILFTKKGTPTTEGAGVKLHRVFSGEDTDACDPFLLLDDFGSDDSKDYVAGFPWHPHRGIETVTYMITGNVEHEDSLGNKGVIGAGDVQWMTAGSGIIHQEMPKASKELSGFQLWVNLPAKYKMINPRYRGISSDDIPSIEKEGIRIRIICGSIGSIVGPVNDTFSDVEYLDITLAESKTYTHDLKPGMTSICYVIEGSAVFGSIACEKSTLVVFDRSGTEITIKSQDKRAARVLLMTGRPLKEPIEWYGPIVMNTKEEIEAAIEEYREGKFIKGNLSVF
jgi:quercetin 2,3-dioxygenase